MTIDKGLGLQAAGTYNAGSSANGVCFLVGALLIMSGTLIIVLLGQRLVAASSSSCAACCRVCLLVMLLLGAHRCDHHDASVGLKFNMGCPWGCLDMLQCSLVRIAANERVNALL
jgi:hypothetical protein